MNVYKNNKKKYENKKKVEPSKIKKKIKKKKIKKEKKKRKKKKPDNCAVVGSQAPGERKSGGSVCFNIYLNKKDIKHLN